MERSPNWRLTNIQEATTLSTTITRNKICYGEHLKEIVYDSTMCAWSRGSSVGRRTTSWLHPSASKRFTSPQCPDRLWGRTCRLFNVYQGRSRGLTQTGRETEHSSHPVSKWRISEVKASLPNTNPLRTHGLVYPYSVIIKCGHKLKDDMEGL